MGGFHPGFGNFGILGGFGILGIFGIFGGATLNGLGLLGDEPEVEDPDLGVAGLLDDPEEKSDLGAKGFECAPRPPTSQRRRGSG